MGFLLKHPAVRECRGAEGLGARGGEFDPAEKDAVLEQTLSPASSIPSKPFLLSWDGATGKLKSLGPLFLPATASPARPTVRVISTPVSVS